MISKETRARAKLSLLLFTVGSAYLTFATSTHAQAVNNEPPAPAFVDPQAPSDNTLASAVSAPAALVDTETIPLTGSQIQEILDQHNNYRARHGSPSLTWSNSLARDAEIALINCQPFSSRSQYGRNEFTSVEMDFYLAVKTWYDQIRGYNFEDPSHSSRNSGTFSQVVWKSSKRIGCAVKECASDDGESGSDESSFVHLCEYDPPGNVVTRLYTLYKKNVLPASKNA